MVVHQSKPGASHQIRVSSFHRPQNRLRPAATAGGAAPRPDPTVYRLQQELDQGGDPPEPCPHLMETPTAVAAVSPSPGDTVSAPCRRSRPGPAALDRLRQWWGDRPPRGPSRYGRLDESSTGGSGGRPPWGRGRQAAAGRQAGLTIGPNHASLSPQIDHGAYYNCNTRHGQTAPVRVGASHAAGTDFR
eukprot:COSAG01_NODE_5653_length_4115_cov_19.861803_1_plen_189_part_00